MIMEYQEKRGLRVTAAILFLVLCALYLISNTIVYADSWKYYDNAGYIIISLSSTALNLAVYAAIAFGLLARREGNGLRITMGAIFATLLIVQVSCIIGIGEKIILPGDLTLLILLGAAIVLFVVRRISVAGVGFSLLAWYALMNTVSMFFHGYGFAWTSLAYQILSLSVFALAAVICFLNDHNRYSPAAKPLGIAAIVLLSSFFLFNLILSAVQISDSPYSIESAAYYIGNLTIFTLLCGGTLFAILAIAFRNPAFEQIPHRNPQWQPIPQQPQWQQPLRPSYTPTEPTEWACPNCDTKNAPSARFCCVCGAMKPAPESRSIVFCPNCGNAREPGAMFCSNCGTRLN